MVVTRMTWHSRPWVPGHSLMFDIRYQYALHTTSFKEQLIFKNSLTNFRAAVNRYNQEYGVDLIQEEIEVQWNTGKESKKQEIMREKK